MNRIILLNVEDAWIKRGGETAGASGSANAVTLRMRFDQCWDGTSKTAYFTDALGENSVKVLLGLDLLTEDGAYDVPVPGEAMAYPGQATVTVVGESQGRVITTQAARFRVLDAMVPDSAGNSKPITPDEASQLQAQIDALEDIFVVNREQAKTAADEAESAKNAVLEALDNLPPGAVLVIDDLNTGGKTVALSAEQGKVLEETKANRQLSNLDTPQAALAAIGAGVRPNELDNPGLDINQRGQLSYDTSKAASYTVDRWWNIFGAYDVATRTVTSTNQTYGAAFRQPISNPSRFAGKTATFTVWVLSGSGTMGLTKSTGLNSGLSPIAVLTINGPGVYSVAANIPEDVGGKTYPYLFVTVSTPVGRSIQFVSPIPFKLEFGEGQTLAYKDSEGNWQLLPQPNDDYATQLLQCQQHAYLLKGATRFRANYCSSAALDFTVFLPVPLRTTPTIQPDGFAVYSFPDMQAQTGFTFSIVGGSGSNTATIRATKTGHGLTDAVLYVSGNQILEASL